MKTQKICLFMLIALAYISSGMAQTGYKVIVNKSVEVTALSKSDLSKIFLKKMVKWSDKSKILPVDQSKDSSVRDSFSEDVHEKGVNAINAYWQRQIFSGRSVPPPEKDKNRDIVAYVKINQGAIGYVSKKTNTSDVKEIEVTD